MPVVHSTGNRSRLYSPGSQCNDSFAAICEFLTRILAVARIPLGALIVNPLRPHRVEPRVKKRRPKSFPLMIKARQELRQQLLQQELRG
jgi:hypothetical protein